MQPVWAGKQGVLSGSDACCLHGQGALQPVRIHWPTIKLSIEVRHCMLAARATDSFVHPALSPASQLAALWLHKKFMRECFAPRCP